MSNERSKRPSDSTTIGTSVMTTSSCKVQPFGCPSYATRRLHMDIKREIEIDAEPGEVVGGEGTFRWDDGDVRHAVVEEVEPERRFAFTWEGSRVVIELEELPIGTRMIVVESPAAEWSSALELRACALSYA